LGELAPQATERGFSSKALSVTLTRATSPNVGGFFFLNLTTLLKQSLRHFLAKMPPRLNNKPSMNIIDAKSALFSYASFKKKKGLDKPRVL